jgi:hypothetical protein
MTVSINTMNQPGLAIVITPNIAKNKAMWIATMVLLRAMVSFLGLAPVAYPQKKKFPGT